jgi:indolepyruvate ferredoxin oxidoreductase beta subunit
MLTGVGGQGSVLASRLLAKSALLDDKDVKLAETFGAATRGGSVSTHVRIGNVWSPMMMEDEADAVLALEPLEGLRMAVGFLKPGGWVLLNTYQWTPLDVAVGRVEYPSFERIVGALERLGGRVLPMEATALAVKAGDERAANSVMLGGLFALDLVNVAPEGLFKAMEERWPDQLVEVNREAYRLGYQAVRQLRRNEDEPGHG